MKQHIAIIVIFIYSFASLANVFTNNSCCDCYCQNIHGTAGDTHECTCDNLILSGISCEPQMTAFFQEKHNEDFKLAKNKRILLNNDMAFVFITENKVENKSSELTPPTGDRRLNGNPIPLYLYNEVFLI